MIWRDEPVVGTSAGLLRGSWQNGVQVFRGVPYGAPTSGGRRFLPPVPAESWDGVRDATRFGHYSPQVGAVPMWCDPTYGSYMTGGRAAELIDANIAPGEDCLVLNVLTHSTRPVGQRPVMVYLHGGGFHGMCGTIPTLADRFVAEQDVVLVTVNHRLTAFGFLYLGALDQRYSTGNVGLLDLVLALRWVRDNIAAFGGDPGNVTVFGESGGGGKVLNLMTMEAAHGLFHRAIIQSSSWPDPIPAEQATDAAVDLLAKVGVGTNLERLADVPTETLIAAIADGPPMRFWPVLDGRTITTMPWQTTAPPQTPIPMIVGNCRHEMTNGMLRDPALFDLEWQQVVPQLVRMTALPSELVAHVVEVFLRNRPTESASEIFRAIMSGRLREIGDRVAELQSAQQTNVYRYDFTYAPPMHDPRMGAFHTAELPLALRMVLFPESEQLSQQLGTAWANFAHTGDPNHERLPTWLPYRHNRATLLLNEKPELVHDPGQDERIAVGRLPHLQLRNELSPK